MISDLFLRTITFVYNNYLRQKSPGGCKLCYNGVLVNKERKPTDFLDIVHGGWKNHSHNPNYESAINRRLRQHVQHSDDVVVVGGGLGTSTVTSARQTSDAGSVVTYEGSIEMVQNVRKSISINGVSDIAEVNHAIVSKSISLRGERGDASVVKPESLPDCDVLELDCEGAEIDIIKNMRANPRIIIVESHGMYDTSSKKVANALNSAGYEILSREIAENWAPANEFCEKNGIDVLTAVDPEQI